MDEELEQAPQSAGAVADPAAGAARAPDEAETEGAAPVVLADAMCGAFCSIRTEARQA